VAGVNRVQETKQRCGQDLNVPLRWSESWFRRSSAAAVRRRLLGTLATRGKDKMRQVFILSLPVAFAFSASASAQTKSADFLPLCVGNSWTYDYIATDWDLQEDIIRTDSGTAVYSILSALPSQDSTIWCFMESRSIVHREVYVWPPAHTDSSSLVDSSTFNLVEYHAGNHRLLANGSSWTSVFFFNSRFTDSSKFQRYFPSQSQDTFTVRYADFQGALLLDAVDVTYHRGIGLANVRYRAPGYVGDAPQTNHLLRHAELTSVEEPHAGTGVDSFTLEQVYPNPFNPSTSIRLRVQSRSRVSIRIFDMLGRLVSDLVNDDMQPGIHTVVWNPIDISSGVYIVVARAGAISRSIKLVLVK